MEIARVHPLNATTPRLFISRPRAVRGTSETRDHAETTVLRRHLATGALAVLLSGIPFSSQAKDVQVDKESIAKDLDTEITQKVVFEIGMCEDSTRINRTLGEDRFCYEVAPLGKITFGLFGNLLPVTVSNFIKTIERGSYNGTVVNRVITGEFFSVGKQGSRRVGEVEAPSDLQSNPELATSKAFALKHARPGTLSLAIAQNEDPTERTLSRDYHPTQFLVTTGPGPAPQLDNGNVVFGRVVDGFETLGLLAEVRTYKPSSRIQAFNAFATAIGDERAAEVRKTWGRPIQPVVITSAKIVS